MEIPQRDEHADELMREKLFGFAFFPPVVRIEISVAGAGDGDGNGRRKRLLEDIAGAASVIVGSDNDDATEVMVGGKAGESHSFFFGAIRVMRKRKDFIFGDAAFDEIVLFEFGDAGAGAEAAAAGDDERRNSLADEFSGAGSAIGVEIVVAKEKNRVGMGGGSVDDPGIGCIAQDGVARPKDQQA